MAPRFTETRGCWQHCLNRVTSPTCPAKMERIQPLFIIYNFFNGTRTHTSRQHTVHIQYNQTAYQARNNDNNAYEKSFYMNTGPLVCAGSRLHMAVRVSSPKHRCRYTETRFIHLFVWASMHMFLHNVCTYHCSCKVYTSRGSPVKLSRCTSGL